MKKMLFPVAACSLLFLLQSCLKDTCRNTYRIYEPIYKTLTQARADMKSGSPQAIQNTGKIYVYGNYIFLNELNRGIHVIDNTNPSSPKNLSFINIPNNVDLAVKSNYLYADSYSDIVVFDISDPRNVRTVKFLDNILKERNAYWYGTTTSADSLRVLTGYNERDTTVDCDTYRTWYGCPSCMFRTNSGGIFYAGAPQANAAAPGGVGGSMARFTTINDYLYTVSTSRLYSINISNPSDPQPANTKTLSGGIETIYPFRNKLFIGSSTGMFIYDLANPADPVQQGQFSHFTSCDPVIADAQYAYVTLHAGTTCRGTLNELDIVDIANLSSPVLKKTYNMSSPHGLAKDGDYLFICDGTEGLKVYDAADPNNLQLIKEWKGMETFDVIARNGNAIVVAKDGLYQYDYSTPGKILQISKINISN